MARLENLTIKVEKKKSRLPDSSKHKLDSELERIEKMLGHANMLNNECRYQSNIIINDDNININKNHNSVNINNINNKLKKSDFLTIFRY